VAFGEWTPAVVAAGGEDKPGLTGGDLRGAVGAAGAIARGARVCGQKSEVVYIARWSEPGYRRKEGVREEREPSPFDKLYSRARCGL